MPEEAWGTQSLEASAEQMLSALDSGDSCVRRTALQILLDNLGRRPGLAAAIAHAFAG